MATCAITVFGALSLQRLPVDLLPDLSYPSLTVRADWPDASPLSVERFLTRPIEEAVGVVPGVRSMRSTSRAGTAEVVLEFDWDEPMELAALDVREKAGLVELPEGADLPRVLRYDPSLDPVVRLALRGEARGLDALRQLAERWLKPRLEAVEGVAAAKIRGGLEPEVQVEADNDRLATFGLTLDDVARALEAENVDQPGGTLTDMGAVYLVRTLHEFQDLEQVRRTVVAERPEGRVRVEDVAEVRRGHRDRAEITRADGQETVELALYREGSANTITVSQAIALALDDLRDELHGDLELVVLTDRSRYVADAVGQVWSAALLGGVLAVGVLFFFLRDPASTVIVALTIPLSVVASFLPMQQAGVSLNIMSLGGLALGVGMLVDNSIVVLEAIARRRAEGLSRLEAAGRGAGEVAGAVTAATLTTISVFLPIVFVLGVAGQLFYDLAVTVCLSLLASLVFSLTLIPALAALDPRGLLDREDSTLFAWDQGPRDDLPGTWRLAGWELAPLGDGVHPISRALSLLTLPLRLLLAMGALLLTQAWRLGSWAFLSALWPATRAYEGLAQAYPGWLWAALRRRRVVLPVTFVLLLLAVRAVPLLGTDLVPDLAQGEFAFQLTLPEGTPLSTTAAVVERVEQRLRDDDRFARVFSLVGSLPSSASGRRTLGENLAQVDVVLPTDAGAAAEVEAVRRVREVLAAFPRAEAELVRPQVINLAPPVEVRVFADDLATLEAASDRVADALRGLPGLRDVATTSEPGSPEVTVELDRERAGTLGMRAQGVGDALRRQLHGELVGRFREGEERIEIRVRAAERFRGRAEAIADLRVRLADGTTLPISALAKVGVGQGPAAIHRANGSRVARVSAGLADVDLGEALARAEAAVRAVELPTSVTTEIGGQDAELERSFSSLRLALGLAVFLVFVVMAVQFESLLHPFVILLAVPLGLVGVIAALLLTQTPLGVLSLIGTVMLAGIVVNNAIVLIDAVNRRRAAGEPVDTALVQAGVERLRPILMTTVTTVLALLPMALGLGAGDELRRPLAVAVIGGLTGATALTLIVVPCLYRVLTPDSDISDAGPVDGPPA